MNTMDGFGQELALAVKVGRNGCHHKTQHRRKPINRGSHGIYSWDHGENLENRSRALSLLSFASTLPAKAGRIILCSPAPS